MKWLLGILATLGGLILALIGRPKDTKPDTGKRDASLKKSKAHATKAKTAKKRAKDAKDKAQKAMEAKNANSPADVAARFNRLRKRPRRP